MLQVSLNDVSKQWEEISNITEPKVLEFLRSGQYISQKYVTIFENEFSKYCKTNYAIGVSNGTDALRLAYEYLLNSRNIDEIIIPANTFASDIFTVGNTPVKLIDCDKYYQIDTSILHDYLKKSNKSSIVCITHMLGHPSDIETVKKLCDEYGAYLIEDCSHAHGSETTKGKVGTTGIINTFSLYPGKTLGAAGESGIITTNDTNIDSYLKLKRHLGMKHKYHHEIIGVNNRMDDLQAIILSEKLKHLDAWIDKKNKVAEFYNKHLNTEFFTLPETANWVRKISYYSYTVRVAHRDKLKNWLASEGIASNIYWPIPIQKMTMYSHLDHSNNNTVKWAGEMLSLPIHPYLTDEELHYVVSQANMFYENKLYDK